MHKMDEYQVAYQKFRVNIKDSSAVSMQLYFSLRNFVNMLQSNISERLASLDILFKDKEG